MVCLDLGVLSDPVECVRLSSHCFYDLISSDFHQKEFPYESNTLAFHELPFLHCPLTAPPSWGAETDASTEYPGTQTTSSGSDKATPSSGSSCSVDGSQATVPQTLPLVSSTPYEDDVTTALPGYV